MLILFLIIVIGSLIGSFTFAGFGLKGAGVLITAMVFGHYGYQIPAGVSEFGLLLFVYAVGLQAGSRFFRYFLQHPKVFIVVGVVPVLVCAILIIILSRYSGLPQPVLLGIFSGALTNTPSFASLIDYYSGPETREGMLLSVGYGIAYPFGILGFALFIQSLPGLFRRNLEAEASAHEVSKSDELIVKHFRVSNKNCFGTSIKDLNTRNIAGANISRVTRDGRILIASPELVLQENDIVTAVSAEKSVKTLKFLFGEEVTNASELGKDIISVDLEVSLAELTGKTLKQIGFVNEYNVVITRVRRQGIEFSPTADTILEFADVIRVVGSKNSVESISKILGKERTRIQETNMLPFISGILLGICLGSVPVYLTEKINFELGLSGGCFIVALLLGHYGKIGPLKIYVPLAASNLCRELGIVLFMAGAGISAGSNFISTLSGVGISALLYGAAVTAVFALVSFFLAYYLYKRNLLYSLGLACGAANNSLPLGYLREASKSDYASLAYATVYPVSLIFKIIAAQLLLRL